MRIRGAKTELEDAGLDTEGMAESVSKLREEILDLTGVDIQLDEDTFKSTYQILKEISEVWDDLSDISRANVTELLAGKRQGNILSALMTNFDIAEQVADTSANRSQGSAQKELANYQKGIEYSLGQFRAAFQELSTDFITSDLVKGVVDFGTGIIDVLDATIGKFGALKTVIAGLGIAAIATDFMGLKTSIVGMLEALSMVEKISDIPVALSAATSSIGVFIAAALAIAGVVTVFDHFHTSAGEALESFSKQKESFDEAKMEVDDLNAQLEETQSKIDALEAKENLSLVEEEDLNNLREQNAQLETTIKLREAELKLEAKKNANQAHNLFNEWTTVDGFTRNGASNAYNADIIRNNVAKDEQVANVIQTVMGGRLGDTEYAQPLWNDLDLEKSKDQINELLASYQTYEKYATAAEKKLVSLGDAEGDEIDRLKAFRDEMNNKAFDTQEYIDNYASVMQLVKDAYTELEASGENLTTSQRSELNSAQAFLTEYHKMISDSAKEAQDSIKEIFSDPRFKNFEKRLQNEYKNGNFGYMHDLITDTPGFQELYQSYNVTPEQIEQYIANSVNPDELNIDKVKEQLKNLFSSDDYEVKIKLGEQADAVFDKFLEDKSDTEIEIFYKYVNAHGVDISKMTPEELESTMDIAIESSGAVTSIDEISDAFSGANEGASTLLETIGSINNALSAQSTGKSISQDVYNSEDLKDYQSALEYVNGTLQYNADKVKEITKNKVEEQIATNDAAKALQQAKYAENTAELERMRTELAGINPNLKEYSDKLTEIRSLEADNSAIAAKCDYLNLLNNQLRESIGAYQAWKDAQNMGSTGDMASDVRSAMKNITDVFDPESDQYLRTGEGNYVYTAAVDFLVPDTVDSSDQNAVKEYIDNLGTYFTGDEGGATKFISEAIDKGLMEYTPDGEGIKVAADKTMGDFANAFNWTDEATQAMFGDLETYGFSFSWADEANKTVEDLAVSAGEAVNDLSKLGETNARIRVDVSDIETADEKVAVLDNTIAEVSQIRSTLSVDSSEYEEAQTVIAYCLAQKQQLEQPAVMQVDTSIVEGKIGEAIALLQQFQEAKNALDSKTALGMDTSGAQDSVNGLVESIKGLDPNITAALNIDTSSAETIAASIAELSPEVMVKAGIDDSAIIGYSPDDKNAKVIFGVDSTAVDNYSVSDKQGTVIFSPDDSAIHTWIPPVKQGKIVYSPSGGSDLNGTANVNGTAFTKGDWGATRTETALVGELGREIVVDSRTGKWHTVGDNGAEFTKINRGDIIFNHKQTEELLARGFVNGRGSAYLNGNAYVTGELQNSALLNNVKGYTETKANTDATVANTAATKEDTKQKTKSAKSAKKLGDLYDWVAVRLQRFADKTKEIADKITDYVTSAVKTNLLTQQIRANQNEIGANQYAAWLYRDQANTVAKKTKMSKKLVNKAQSGAWEFENLSKKEKEKVTAYLKYYDKYREATSKVQELRNAQLELYEQWANMPAEEASKKIEKLSNSMTILSNSYNLASSGASALAQYAKIAGNSAGRILKNSAGQAGYVTGNAYLEQQKRNMANQVNAYSTAYNQASANASAALANISNTRAAATTARNNVTARATALLSSKNIKKALNKSQEDALKAGVQVSTKGLSGDALKKIKAYNELVAQAQTASASAADAVTKYNIATEAQQAAFQQLAESQQEYAQMIVENEQKKFDNIKNFYDLEIEQQKQIVENAEKERKYWQAYGNDLEESQFQTQIDAMERERIKMQEQQNSLEAQLKSAERNGIIVGSEEWLKMSNQLGAIQGNIRDIDVSILELQDEMRNEVFYQALDKALKKAEQLRGSLSTIRDIITDEMMFDDDGRMTDFGITALAMNVKEYESYLDSMGDLLAKRQKYIDAFNGDNNSTNYSEKEFNEDIANIESEIQNLLKNTDSARKAIIDMVTKASKAELDAIFKAIEARQKLLKKQKEYYDYDKTLKGKTRDLQLLEQQERALQNSANAEDKAMLARVRAQRIEAQEALDETVRDHVYNLQIEGLDDLKTELQENYDNYVKDLSRNLELITETVNDTTESINGALTTVNDTIAALLGSYGVNGLTGASIGLPTFAGGSRRVGRNTYGLTNERAGEIVIGDRGVFVPLSASSAVVRPELTNRLFDLADNYNSIMSIVGKNGAISSIQSNEGNNISPIINAPISIVGNQIDEQGVIRAINKQLPIISRTVQEDIRKDLRKSR